MLYWEDFPAGDTVEMGSHTFTEAEITFVCIDEKGEPIPIKG